VGAGWGTFRISRSSRVAAGPYGCEFCTVTQDFFGDSIRFRTTNVVNELLLLKERAREEGGQIAEFFHRDNFCHQRQRTKSVALRDYRRERAMCQKKWVAPDSTAQLLRDEDLVDLIASAEAIDFIRNGIHRSRPTLADVNKGFNKNQVNMPWVPMPLASPGATFFLALNPSFIFVMDNDTPGVRSDSPEGNSHLASWAGLSLLMTPLPRTPLYRAGAAGPPTRPAALARIHPFVAMGPTTPLKYEHRRIQNEVRYWVD